MLTCIVLTYVCYVINNICSGAFVGKYTTQNTRNLTNYKQLNTCEYIQCVYNNTSVETGTCDDNIYIYVYVLTVYICIDYMYIHVCIDCIILCTCIHTVQYILWCTYYQVNMHEDSQQQSRIGWYYLHSHCT